MEHVHMTDPFWTYVELAGWGIQLKIDFTIDDKVVYTKGIL